MNNKEDTAAWERLADIVTDAESVSKAELKAELEAEGVDVNRLVEGVQRTVRHAFQEELRRRAEEERAAARNAFTTTAAEVASWPLEKLKQWLADAQRGLFGPEVAGLAAACHRNKEDKDLTETEARSFVADIISSVGK